MPRRREKKITLSELRNAVEVYKYIKHDAVFDGYDLATFTITVKANITPVIKNAERSAKFLENYLAANPNCCQEYQGVKYVYKHSLARMLRVSRSTLDKWLDDELIKPVTFGSLHNAVYLFDPYAILEQLKNYKKE